MSFLGRPCKLGRHVNWVEVGKTRLHADAGFTIVYCVPCGLTNVKYGKLGHPSQYQGWRETLGAKLRLFSIIYRKLLSF